MDKIEFLERLRVLLYDYNCLIEYDSGDVDFNFNDGEEYLSFAHSVTVDKIEDKLKEKGRYALLAVIEDKVGCLSAGGSFIERILVNTDNVEAFNQRSLFAFNGDSTIGTNEYSIRVAPVITGRV